MKKSIPGRERPEEDTANLSGLRIPIFISQLANSDRPAPLFQQGFPSPFATAVPSK